MITDEKEKKLLTEFLMQRCDAKFFGKVMIVFQDGHVIHLIEEKSYVLDKENN